jgi:hypothetical protein
MKIGKYEFKDQETAEAKIEGLGQNDHSVVKLGHIILEIAENEDDYVFSDKYHVDVMWVGLDDHPYGWKSAAVGNINDNGVHSFYGVDYQTNKM